LYNRCTGIYKFGNNTYPRRIRCRSNLGHIFQGKKSVSYGLGNMVYWQYMCSVCPAVFGSVMDTVNTYIAKIYNK